MDCIVQPPSPFWTGVVSHGLPSYPQRNYFSNMYFQRKHSFPSFYPGHSLFFPHDDDVDYPTDIKGELTSSTMPYLGMADENGEVKLCVVCGERASGFYFGALVCLPCKSFYIRCTKEGEPAFTCQCSGNCDIVKQGRIRCQYCRYQRCLMAGMCRKEKPETVQPAEGQVLCKVCGDIANGIHFGVNTCEGCKKFFRRGLVENQSYICKNEKDCGINPRNRNNCRYCRYQKCIGVGMSREAIKMGRPKKADGNEMTSPITPDSPKLRRHEGDVEINPQQTLTNLSGSPGHPREDSNDTLNSNSVRDTIKQEPGRSSCNFEKKSGEMWSHNERSRSGIESSWQPCGQMTHNVGVSRQNVAANEFGEDDMDEILKLLQDDHNQSQQEHKKMRGYGYNMAAAKECKTEFCEGSGAPWHIPENIQAQQQTMSAMNMTMSEPMNMTTGQLAQIPTRPPPQYPGLTGDQHSVPSPQCHSPRQMHSPGSYMSDSSAQSPGYVPNGCSPVHSPCHYSPSHSPNYQQSCPSPQNSSYHYDSSPQGSPMFPQNNYNSPNTYIDLSVNVNCGPSTMNPGSPSHSHSPIYNNLSSGQSSTNLPMTIPTQEGGGNSHDGWFMIGSPSQCCHSPSQTQPQQERGYKQRGAAWNENLQRINNFFNNQCERSDLHLNVEDDIDGTMNRNDVEREVVHKLLSSVSPSESYFYVMSDNHSSDSNSGSNYDEFTSCRRMNKRKNYDDSDMCDVTGAGFQIGKYKRQLTEKYWYMSAAMEEAYPMTTEKQAILEHLSQAFQQMADRCTDTAKRCNAQDARSWQQIQMRIVKNSSAFVKFALQIPGFSSIHPEDKSFLCQHVSFMSLLLLAGHQLYNPTENNFRDFWNWNINQHNPFYGFKQRLLEVGQQIHNAKMDIYEISSLVALTILASDFAELAYPEAIEDSRRKILAALRSYELSKGVSVKSRLGELFSLIPSVRHVGMWHHELMRQMKLHIQPQEVHQLVDNVQYGNF